MPVVMFHPEFPLAVARHAGHGFPFTGVQPEHAATGLAMSVGLHAPAFNKYSRGPPRGGW